jgi:hypothetical protein
VLNSVLRYVGIGILLLSAWIAWDMAKPRTHDLREFDGREVERLETAMWRSYYDHRPVALFAELSELLRTQYGFPFWRSVAGAYYAARAAVVFQAGSRRTEYERALPALVSYYALIRRTNTPSFDVNKAAALELEWWIVHRERTRYGTPALERSLADLQAAIYARPGSDFEEHARARAEAMLLRDEQAGDDQADDKTSSAVDWKRIGELLDVSWRSAQNAASVTTVTRPLNC